jgi:hypothetical protein
LASRYLIGLITTVSDVSSGLAPLQYDPGWTRILHPTGIPKRLGTGHYALNFRIAENQPSDDSKRYDVLQESSAPRADEHAIWDTFAIPQAWFSTGDAKPVRDLMRDLERVNRGEP